MLILSLASIERAPMRLREEVPVDSPLLQDTGIVLDEPLQVDLEASSVGEGVLVRGEIRAALSAACRRCLVSVPIEVRDTIDLLFEPLTAAEALELGGEVYPLPERGDELDLSDAIREQLLVRVPDYVVCSDSCRGLCPTCGTELNQVSCSCVPENRAGPWDALKNIKFD